MFRFTPIGYVSTDAVEVPRFYTSSEVEGSLVIDEQYQEGLSDIIAGQKITVIFNFHKSFISTN